MTVVHVVEPFASGVTTAIINIVQELKKVNHIVVHGSRSWVDSGDKVKDKFPPGTRFVSWKYAEREISPIRDALALGFLLAILKKLNAPDLIVHLHSSKAGFLGRLACLLAGIRRVIYTPHGASFIRRDIGPWKRFLFRTLERLGGLFSGVVVGCGRSEGELYGSPGRPSLWVANGVAPSGSSPPVKKRFVCFAGIANHQKNPALFNAIAEAFGGDSPEGNSGFLWIGDGFLKSRLRAPNIAVTGWVSPGEVRALLEESLVYLSASGWEGLPYGVLEAMDAACALVLSDVPGNRDVVEEGVNGYLYRESGEAAERLRELRADRKKALAMGAASRRIAEERFSLRQMGEAYYSIYCALLADKVPSPQAVSRDPFLDKTVYGTEKRGDR
ncbi:MAG: glycosyltransferase [Treponema sp.]|jgi:glycosyltransferase involved in cell wall biosynthesis|nr:glycosyltransferase [Treponema sp.]